MSHRARQNRGLPVFCVAPMCTTRIFPHAVFAFAALLLQALPAFGNERILGRCEGCDAVFEGRPKVLASIARIAPDGSAGEALKLSGTVRSASGRVAPGILVYAYQTDPSGRYPPNPALKGASARHGLFRGFAVTDSMGHYRFDTIRPTGYPDTPFPQHIHMHIVEPGRCTYFIDDVVFDDDPRLDELQRKSHLRGRGGLGLVKPIKRADRWEAVRDIELGRGISDYAECGNP